MKNNNKKKLLLLIWSEYFLKLKCSLKVFQLPGNLNYFQACNTSLDKLQNVYDKEKQCGNKINTWYNTK